jgi:hypothetical protein
MNFSMVRPCEKCPFRKDIRAYLRKGRVIEIVSALKNGGTFACHETVHLNDDGDPVQPTPEEQFCAGAMVMLENVEIAHLNQMVRIAERLGFYDPEKLDMKSPVFDCFSDMIEAQDR